MSCCDLLASLSFVGIGNDTAAVRGVEVCSRMERRRVEVDGWCVRRSVRVALWGTRFARARRVATRVAIAKNVGDFLWSVDLPTPTGDVAWLVPGSSVARPRQLVVLGFQRPPRRRQKKSSRERDVSIDNKHTPLRQTSPPSRKDSLSGRVSVPGPGLCVTRETCDHRRDEGCAIYS